jgi:cytochrome P450
MLLEGGGTMSSVQADIFSPAFTATPYSTYAYLRAEAPIHRVTLPDDQTVWLITHYDDVVAVLKDPRFIKNWRNAMTEEQLAQMPSFPQAMGFLHQHMLALDPPDHTRLRTLIHKAFTPRLIEQLRPRIQEIADTLLDAVQPNGAMDLIDDYALPLPSTVIAELLGVPVEDQNKFRAWANILAPGEPSPDRLQQIAPAMQAFFAYFAAMFAQRRAHPTEDLISKLMEVEEAGDKLSERELFSMLYVLLIAGHDPPVYLIGNGMLALLQYPDQLEHLKQSPELISSAIEELLRYVSPVETSTMRFAREDVEIGGVVIGKGEQVLVVIASANHDERRFADPERLDLTRGNNRHVAFGRGIHHCLGTRLARLEGQIAISTLLRRMPNLQLAVAPEIPDSRPTHRFYKLSVTF